VINNNLKTIIDTRGGYNETFIILIFFVVSRIIYKFFLNIQFDGWTLTSGVYDQFFPINLLKNDLLQSLMNNALQPPLLNLITGLLIKVTSNYIIYIQLIFLICGFLNFFFFNKILIELNFSKKIRLILTIILMILPTTILYENHFYKEYPSMFLITVLVYLSIKIINFKKKNISYKIIIVFTLALSLLLLLRETFNIFWGYIFLLFLLIVTKEYKKFIIAFVILNFLVLPFYVKNYYLYDRFGINLQFWRGMNQSISWVGKIKTENSRQEFKKFFFKDDINFNNFISQMSVVYDEGTNLNNNISDLIILLRYQHKYDNSLLHSKTFFNEVFIKKDELHSKDVKKFIKHYPEIIIFRMSQALIRYFFRSSDVFYFVKPNARKIPNLLRVTSCLKLTLSCIYEAPFVKIYKEKWLIEGTNDIYLENDKFNKTYKNLILYEIYDINFILVFLYFALFFYFLINIHKSKKNVTTALVNFWLLTFFYIFAGLIMMENYEISRHRFPFDYLSIIFLLYYIKNTKISIKK